VDTFFLKLFYTLIYISLYLLTTDPLWEICDNSSHSLCQDNKRGAWKNSGKNGSWICCTNSAKRLSIFKNL